jgi:hypothetical protein
MSLEATDIEKARQLFEDAGLAFPKLPQELAVRLKQLDQWLFSTRPIDVSPYDFEHYVQEAKRTRKEDYAVLAHDGHGINSYAIHYYMVRGPLRMFLQLAWGGVYMDAQAAEAQIRDCFSIADQIVAAAEKPARLQEGQRLTVAVSDFCGSYWLPPGGSRAGTGTKRSDPMDLRPLNVLSEALRWLQR